MSLYVSTDNQNLLWRLLHQHEFFAQCSDDYKTSIFRQTIEKVYYEIESSNDGQLTYKELQLLNQKTLHRIFQIISPKHQSSTSSPPMPPKVQMVETPEEKSVREFNERQQMYESMTSKPTLPDSSSLFKEESKGETNEVITNMDELLEKYQAQRDFDVPKVEIKEDTHQDPSVEMQKNISISQYELLVQKMTEIENQLVSFREKQKEYETRLQLLEPTKENE